MRFEVNKAGTYYIAVRSDKANSGLRFNDQEYSINANITYSSSRLEIEPNDGGDGKPSTRLIEGVEFSGQLYSENDNDYYQIDVAQKGSITISFRSPLSSSLKYFNLYVVDKDGVLLAGTETGNNTTLDLNISEPGSYFIGVRSNFANGGTRFNDEEYSPHPSFIRQSINKSKIEYFNEKNKINADGFWMKNIRKKKYMKIIVGLVIITILLGLSVLMEYIFKTFFDNVILDPELEEEN